MTNILYSVFKPVEKPYSCNSVNYISLYASEDILN